MAASGPLVAFCTRVRPGSGRGEPPKKDLVMAVKTASSLKRHSIRDLDVPGVEGRRREEPSGEEGLATAVPRCVERRFRSCAANRGSSLAARGQDQAERVA